MDTQAKGKQIQNIDLVEGMVLICTRDADYHIYTVGKEYEVSTYLEKLTIIGDNKLHYDYASALFIVKEQQPLSFANTKIDLRDANGNVDEAKSIAFQEAAFKEGYHWGNSGATLQFTDKPFLFINEQYSEFSYVDHSHYEFFLSRSGEFTEITFEYEHKLEYKIALKVDTTVEDKLSEKEVKLNKVISDLEEQLSKAYIALEDL